MKEVRQVILSLKDGEFRTKEQLLKELEPILDRELEQLRREGEIYFPKDGIIQRIG